MQYKRINQIKNDKRLSTYCASQAIDFPPHNKSLNRKHIAIYRIKLVGCKNFQGNKYQTLPQNKQDYGHIHVPYIY